MEKVELYDIEINAEDFGLPEDEPEDEQENERILPDVFNISPDVLCGENEQITVQDMRDLKEQIMSWGTRPTNMLIDYQLYQDILDYQADFVD